MSDQQSAPAGTDPVDDLPTATRGQRLQQAREQAGLGIAEVAARLRLSQAQVVALEQDDLAALPPAPFVRGFVRNYARMLGVAPEQFDETLQPVAAAVLPSVALHPLPPAEAIRLETGRNSANRRWLVAAAGALVLGLVVGALRLDHLNGARDLLADTVQPAKSAVGRWFGTTPPAAPAPAPVAYAAGPAGAVPGASGLVADVAANPVAPVDVTPSGGPANPSTMPMASPAGLPATEGVATASAAPPAAAAASPALKAQPGAVAVAGDLTFSFAGDSWVEVRDARDTVLYSGTSHAGETQTVPLAGVVRVVIGNAVNTHLSLNGRELALAPHTKVTVARLTIDPASNDPATKRP